MSVFSDYSRAELVQIGIILSFILIAQLGYATVMLAYITMLLLDSDEWLYFVSQDEDAVLFTNIALALYPLGQFIGSPIIGRAGDTYGRRLVLLTSLGGSFICMIGIGVCIILKNYYFLCLFTFLVGLSESTYAIASSMLADLQPDADKQREL